jgi:putative photosynthetic complex assembly protein 2
MAEYGSPVLYAVFVWWFGTGLVLYLDGLPGRTFRWSLLGASALLAPALYVLAISSADPSPAGAYLAFSCGLLVWGWLEMSYFMGLLTGPRKAPCPAGCTGLRRFGLALQTSLYHELAIIAVAAVLVALTWNGPNQVGVWTFAILWWMRWSAKLNVFLGVRNLNERWLPEHLRYLTSYFTQKPMNPLFPVSIGLATAVTVLLIQRIAVTSANGADATGLILLASLLALAILEHLFLILPLPLDGLWRWGFQSRS